MSPHEQPWLDDYAARHQAELQARWDSEAHVFNIQNAALRVVINECPKPDRTPEDCRICGNENCVKAWKEQNKLWPENACEEPAYRANTTNTNQAAAISPAKSESPDMTKCPAPGPRASGTSLFDLLPESEDEAA